MNTPEQEAAVKIILESAVEKASESLPSPPNSRPFDLELALRGWPLINRHGNSVRLVAYVPDACAEQQIVFLTQGAVYAGHKDGRFTHDKETCLDLFLATLP